MPISRLREEGGIRVFLRVDLRIQEVVTVAPAGDTWVATSVGDAIE